MTVIEPSREALVHRVAAELDRPSLYMGGPSLSSRRKAERIVDLTDDHYQEAVSECERLRNGLRAALDYLQLNDSIDYNTALTRVRAALEDQ